MKIALSSTGKDLASDVDVRFGRAPYFILVDSETMNYEVIENPNVQVGGGAGVGSAKIVVEKGAQVVISGNIGPNAFQVLESTGIEIISGVSGKIREVVEKYRKGELKRSEKADVNKHFGSY